MKHVNRNTFFYKFKEGRQNTRREAALIKAQCRLEIGKLSLSHRTMNELIIAWLYKCWQHEYCIIIKLTVA